MENNENFNSNETKVLFQNLINVHNLLLCNAKYFVFIKYSLLFNISYTNTTANMWNTKDLIFEISNVCNH